MDTDDDLLAAVERAFAETGASTPGWPDPHPDGAPPRQEEYSRVTDRDKFHRILQARLDAWERVLRDTGLALVEVEGRVRRFVPVRAGALALHASTTIVDDAPFGVEVYVSDGEPTLVDRLPGCGCDACDDGSAYLLQELDSWMLTVLHRGVVHADGGVRRWIGAPWR